MSASQSKQALWMVLGWIILIPFCLAHSWELCDSTINPFGRNSRPIERWKTRWPAVTDFLNAKYGNREDGLGAYALIWAGPVRALYMPDTDKPKWLSQWLWESLRAWCWSAWRNSTNELSR